MIAIKATVGVFLVLLALVSALPAPGGWHKGSHEHVIIHVPYHVHTVHHHHVKKVHVPVPVVKKIYIHEEPHYHHPEPEWW